jgi:hypothetical protein
MRCMAFECHRIQELSVSILDVSLDPGANPMKASYDASAVKIYDGMSSPVRSEIWNVLGYLLWNIIQFNTTLAL